jgi:DnaK suppressor protein
MDEIDVAQQNDELFRRAALRAHFAGRQNALMTRTGKAGPSSDGRGALPYHTLCADCGEEIEPARLKALPFAVRCIGCQAKKEREVRNG